MISNNSAVQSSPKTEKYIHNNRDNPWHKITNPLIAKMRFTISYSNVTVNFYKVNQQEWRANHVRAHKRISEKLNRIELSVLFSVHLIPFASLLIRLRNVFKTLYLSSSHRGDSGVRSDHL